jgi:hypothetical protein
MAPSPKQAPRLGDIPGPADLARRVDRLDGIEARLSRLETKTDKILEAVLGLQPGSVPRRK